MNSQAIQLKNITLREYKNLKRNTLKRKNVKISNRELKKLGKYFIEYAPFGIITLNKNGYIDFCSATITNFTDVETPQDLIGIYAPSLPTYQKIGLSDYIQQAYTEGNMLESFPVKYYSFFGAKESVRKFTIVPLKDLWGKVYRLLLLIEDAAIHEQAKEELRKKKDELEKLVDIRTQELQTKVKELEQSKAATLEVLSELNTAYTKLKGLDKIKSDFIDVVSHQLRTPLTSIRWNLEMILTGSLGKVTNPKQKQSLNYIFSGVLTLIENLEDMIAVSSIDTAQDVKIIKEKVSLKALLDEIFKDCQEEANLNKISIAVEKNIKKDVFMIDKVKFKKILKVLVDNAIKYSRVGGKIRIKINKEDDLDELLSIAIIDSGIGINKNQQERMFDKFFRSKNATYHAPNGLGLGLYIAKKYTEAHNGTLSFISVEGEGTTFFVKTPFK